MVLFAAVAAFIQPYTQANRAQWVVGGPFLAIHAFLTAGNLLGSYWAWRTGSNFSMVPFVGGFAGVIGFHILLPPHLDAWAYLAIALDPSVVVNLLGFSLTFVRSLLRRNRP